MNLRFATPTTLLAALVSCAAPPADDGNMIPEANRGNRTHGVTWIAPSATPVRLGAIRRDLFDTAGETDSVDDCTGTPKEIVESMGLQEMTLSFPKEDVDEQVALDGSVCIQDAIAKGLESLLTDASDAESPLALVLDLLNDERAARAALSAFLNRKSTRFALVPLDWNREPGIYPAENGESVESNWVFFMTASDLSDHLFWSIVPRDGGAVTNYGFN